jgi:hypothetical protein
MGAQYNIFKTWPSDTGYVVEETWQDGNFQGSQLVPVAGAPAAAANFATLVSKAHAAITANQTYLGLATPTTAQNTAQVQALTRQMDAVIYYLLQEITGLSTIPGT